MANTEQKTDTPGQLQAEFFFIAFHMVNFGHYCFSLFKQRAFTNILADRFKHFLHIFDTCYNISFYKLR
jgi:hypothetical protein